MHIIGLRRVNQVDIIMRFTIAIAALALLASPVLAQAPAADTGAAPALVKRGATLHDSQSLRIGTIDRVNSDGSIQVMLKEKFVTIPADKLLVSADDVRTTITRSEVSKLR